MYQVRKTHTKGMMKNTNEDVVSHQTENSEIHLHQLEVLNTIHYVQHKNIG